MKKHFLHQSKTSPATNVIDNVDMDHKEEDEVSLWLINIVKLPQYTQLFEDEGYDDLLTNNFFH